MIHTQYYPKRTGDRRSSAIDSTQRSRSKSTPMEGRKEGRAEEGRAHNANRKHMLLEVGVLAVRDGKAAERKPASSAIPAERRLLWWDAVALSAEVGDPTLRECFMPASKGGEQPRETNPCTSLSEGGDGTIEDHRRRDSESSPDFRRTAVSSSSLSSGTHSRRGRGRSGDGAGGAIFTSAYDYSSDKRDADPERSG